jgi:hypothetical protein
MTHWSKAYIFIITLKYVLLTCTAFNPHTNAVQQQCNIFSNTAFHKHHRDDTTFTSLNLQAKSEQKRNGSMELRQDFAWNTDIIATNLSFLLVLLTSPLVAHGVSGGGLDYAGTDISSQNFAGGNYKGKDFTQGMSLNSVTYSKPNINVPILTI